MLGSFKLRMLAVIVIAALSGLAMQSDNRSQNLVAPVLRYVMQDYNVQEKLAFYWENMSGAGKGQGEEVPASGDIILQKPCTVKGIAENYGWFWNESRSKQEFNPGMVLKVRKGTLVQPVMSGRVDGISRKNNGRQVTIIHNDGLTSIYGGLQEVLVGQGEEVRTEDVLGKTGEKLYFELQNAEGPLNPKSLFAGP